MATGGVSCGGVSPAAEVGTRRHRRRGGSSDNRAVAAPLCPLGLDNLPQKNLKKKRT